MFVKKKFSFAIIFTIGLLLTIPSQLSPSFAEDTFYNASTKGITLEYPDDWQVLDELPDPIVVMFYVEDELGLMVANVVVTHTELNDDVNSFELAEELIEELKVDYPDLRVEQEGNIQINDYSSRQKIVSYESDFDKVKQDMVITVVENSAYVFALTTTPEDYSAYQPIFNKMLNSVEISPESILQLIDNNYKNDKVGITANFPTNWISLGSIMYDEYNIPMNVVMSVHPDIITGDLQNIAAVMLGYSENESLPSRSYFDSLESSGCSLPKNTMSIIKFNQMKAIEFQATCIPDGFDTEVDALAFVMITPDNSFFVTYMASDKQYDEKLQEFEKFKDTVTIKNTLDLSDTSAVSSAYDLSFIETKEKISDSLKTNLILYDDSKIKNFNFDINSSTITFTPIANNDENFSIDIQVDEFLDPPYSVEMHGGYAEYFVINDTTTDKKFIGIFAESPVDNMIIKGQLNNSIFENSSNSLVPKWIKTNAGWWAENQIDDNTFVSGIQFLIKEEIISVPQNNSLSLETEISDGVPGWIKNNAGWWAQGLLTDNDFLKGIQYLVEHGIIRV